MGFEIADITNMQNTYSGKGCLVIGDIILDKYVQGAVGRISPEAPIPVLQVNSERYVLGGAANVAGNVRGYNLKTYLAGVLGTDNNANTVADILRDKDIQFVGVNSNERQTTMKSRVIAMNQQLVRVDQEDTQGLSTMEFEALLSNIEGILGDVSVVVISDYNKGVCTEEICKSVIELCKANFVKVIVDPKSVDWTKYIGADLITPNFKEFKEALGENPENTEGQIAIYGQKLLNKYCLDRILVTRSQFGMTMICSKSKPVTYQTIQQEVFDVSGAGDTVIGTIAALLAKGFSFEKAIEISNYAAGLSVSKLGTYTVTAEEVIEYINRTGTWYQDKIKTQEKCFDTIAEWKKRGERVVFTNGCFDILHVGHIDYLNKARLLGTKLVIGLNSDASVKRLKGEMRPINCENARAEMLAALQCVDAVVIFEEDTPEDLIRNIEPDFLVKGGDYKIEDIVGRQYAGEVRTIPFKEGYSTTGIIERLRQN